MVNRANRGPYAAATALGLTTRNRLRDIVVGVSLAGSDRAYPASVLAEQSPVEDQLRNEPIMVALGPDGVSSRGLCARSAAETATFTAIPSPASGL